MRIKRIPKEDLFSVFFVRKPGASIFDFYFNAIDALRPIFAESRFREIVSGFYLNHIGPVGNSWVRISYFVREANGTDAVLIFRSFFRERGMLEDTGQFQTPHQATLSASYGGTNREELFRYFLALETQICLDLMKADLPRTRSMLAKYYCAHWHRFQTRRAPLRAREYFEPFFMELSQTCASLSKEERDQFFSDLEYNGWVHFLINLVVGDDPQRPLSVPQMNDFLKARNLELQIPLDWNPGEGNDNERR